MSPAAGVGIAPAPGAPIRCGAVPEGGVPAGTIALATELATATAAALGALTGTGLGVDPVGVAGLVLAPAVLAALGHGGSWSPPAAPRPAPGGGWLAADLGAPGDEETFARMLDTLHEPATADAVEREAQQWRLPVLAYRAAPDGGGHGHDPGGEPPTTAATTAATLVVTGSVGPGAATVVPGPVRAATPLTGVRVVDCTAMWAGPLCTWLLGALGAEVVTVEHPVRPDGLRAQTSLFAALDRHKSRRALDLRRPDDLARLDALLGESDVLVDSFSARVLPNLGLGPEVLARRHPHLVHVAIPAFSGAGPRRDWVAYGTGVHAQAGLGDLGPRGMTAPAVTYPDPLAGLAAAAEVAAGLLERVRTGRGGRREAPLSAPVATLAARCGPAERAAMVDRPLGPAAAALADRLRTGTPDAGRPDASPPDARGLDADGLPTSPIGAPR